MFNIRNYLCIAAILFLANIQFNCLYSQVVFDIESGIVSTGYNDVRIPGSTGTFLSLSDELDSSSGIFGRLSFRYRFGSGSEALLLFAPLKIEYDGIIDRNITFRDKTYISGVPLTATYKFNSYRLTYRYFPIMRENIEFGIGITLKIRDAYIGMQQNDLETKRTDLGGVPLINFNLKWNFAEKTSLLLDGDALAAPSGRAEDVLLAFTYKATENIALKAGYRILEGGADNNKVYTFSMFHYGIIGVLFEL